jgi:sulfofructose kinase
MSAIPKVDVVGVGLNATDTLIPVHHYSAAGSKVEFRSANVLPGGLVATAMVACQSWGLRTRYVGKDLSTAPRASTNRGTANLGSAYLCRLKLPIAR